MFSATTKQHDMTQITTKSQEIAQNPHYSYPLQVALLPTGLLPLP